MVAKELEAQKNVESIKETDEEKIRSYAMSLIKKDKLNPSNGVASASASFVTSMMSILGIDLEKKLNARVEENS